MIERLTLPVRITIAVDKKDGTSDTYVLEPNINLTEDGVEISTDRDRAELRDGVVSTYTRHRIEWTEVTYS